MARTSGQTFWQVANARRSMYGFEIRLHRYVGSRQQVPCEGYVLTGIAGFRFDPDRGGGYTELDRMFPVVHGLAARESCRGGAAVGTGEHDRGEQLLVVQLRGERRDTQVVTAQPDPNVNGLRLVVHQVVIPDRSGVVEITRQNLVGHQLTFVVHPGSEQFARCSPRMRRSS